MDDLLNRQIYGSFVITRKLGEGGMGAVYEAYNKKLDQRLAIKVLHDSSARDEESIARFEQEALAASRIKKSEDSSETHPNVIRVLDIEQLPDGRRYIVMEFLHGRDLESLLGDADWGPLAIEDAVSILLQICSVLDAAHRAGIVHRDLKPPNVFLIDRPFVVKLLDFGIAKLSKASRKTGIQTHPGWIAGSVGYMAPEQVERPTAVDRRADIFALGCIIYRMFARRMAFDGNYMNVAIAQRDGLLPAPVTSIRPDLDPRWNEIVARCLAYQPEARFPTVKLLAQAIIAATPGGTEICSRAWPYLVSSPESRTVPNDGTFPPAPSPGPPLPRPPPPTTATSAAGAIEGRTTTTTRRWPPWLGVAVAGVAIVAAVAVTVTIGRRGSGGESSPAARPKARSTPREDAPSTPEVTKQAASPSPATAEPSPPALGTPAIRPAQVVPTDEPKTEPTSSRSKKRKRTSRTPSVAPELEPTPTPKTEPPAKPKQPATLDPNGLVGQ